MSCELRKNGIRIRIERQPLQLLEALVDRPGEVVTREELIAKLWPENTFVEFDRSLTRALNKARVAVGDSAANPRYIETVSRRGYRFIAPVTVVADGVPEELPDAVAQPSRARRWGYATAAVAIGTLALGLSLPLASRYGHESPVEIRQITNDGMRKGASIVSDGTRIYFPAIKAGTTLLGQVPVAGGETWTSPVFADGAPFELLDASRDGRELLLSSVGRLWVVTPGNGAAVRPVADVRSNLARWSPDESSIAFVPYDDATVLRLVTAAGVGEHGLAKFSAPIAEVQWSLDGTLLRVAVPDIAGGPRRFYDISPRDPRPLPVLKRWNHEAGSGTWIGKHRFVFASFDDGNVFRLDERDRRPIGLTAGPMRFMRPLWVRQGDRLFALGQSQRGELRRYDRPRSAFDTFLAGISADCLSFSPDGQWVAYVTYPEMELWRSRADGSERLKLVAAPAKAYLPRWSPDGREIAFMRRTNASAWRIHIVSASGGASRPLAEGDSEQTDPTWSGDGRRIAFSSYPWDVNPQSTDVRIADVKTGAVTIVPRSDGYWSPRLSRDGLQVLVVGRHYTGLYLLDVNTGAARQLATEAPCWPEWSRDGKSVLYLNPPTETVKRIALSTRKTTEVMRAVEFSTTGNRVFSEQWHAHWTGYGPDDAPIVLRDFGSEEIYSIGVSGLSKLR